MMINTHKILAKNFINNLDDEKKIIIKESQFSWGNIKPDFASKYKLKKHYLDESIEMIIGKINFLSSLSLSYIYNVYGINKFNQELGVICHFLCDYFCLPHNQRWEFKSANVVKEHLKYEKELNKVAKIVKFPKIINRNVSSADADKFILDLIKAYEQEEGYVNDLKYAYYACNTILNMIIGEILYNELQIEFG